MRRKAAVIETLKGDFIHAGAKGRGDVVAGVRSRTGYAGQKVFQRNIVCAEEIAQSTHVIQTQAREKLADSVTVRMICHGCVSRRNRVDGILNGIGDVVITPIYQLISVARGLSRQSGQNQFYHFSLLLVFRRIAWFASQGFYLEPAWASQRPFLAANVHGFIQLGHHYHHHQSGR